MLDCKTGRAVYEHQKRRGKGNGYYSNICLCRGEGGREERESAGTDGQGGYIGLEGGEQDGQRQEKVVACVDATVETVCAKIQNNDVIRGEYSETIKALAQLVEARARFRNVTTFLDLKILSKK